MIVLWRITERCNLACGFCAYDRRVQRSRRVVEEETVRRFARVLGDVQQISGERVLLSWLGGEPLLWPPLFSVAAQIRRDSNLALSVTSNGSSLHRPGEIDRIVETFAEFTLSVDALGAAHDALRGQQGLFARLQTGVRALNAARHRRDAALKLRANVVLMRDTLAGFAALCDALADWGIDEITFNALGGRDRPEFFPAQGLRLGDVAKLRHALPALRESLQARGVRLCGSAAYLQRFEATARGESIAVSDCAGSEPFLFIDERGRVSPCSFTSDEYGVDVGELRSADDVLALIGRFHAARRAAAARACSDCPSTHVFAKFASA